MNQKLTPNQASVWLRTCSKLKTYALLLCILLSPIASIFAQTVSLSTLRSGHPRLHFTSQKIVDVKTLIQTDSRASSGFNAMKVIGDQIIAGTDDIAFSTTESAGFRGPLFWPIGTGKDVNHYARYLLKRMQYMAGLYVLETDATAKAKWFTQAKKDLLVMVSNQFPYWQKGGTSATTDDWQFLETSALIVTASIGYDWLYPELTTAERDSVSKNLINKGLQPGQNEFAANVGWTQGKGNWGLICNSGMGVGALAIADVSNQATRAQSILTTVRDNMQVVMELYAPDGGGEEGLAYWSYGLEYQLYLHDALDTGLQNDLGLTQAEGFDKTGYYPDYVTGPINKNFNFSDQGDGPNSSIEKRMWLGKKFGVPYFAQKVGSSLNTIQQLLWYDPNLLPPNVPIAAAPAKNNIYQRIGIATLRSDWTDPDGFFIGTKAGSNAASHPHLEIGSFVFDAIGQRWAIDFGNDKYTLPGYFASSTQTSSRFNYYRIRTEGQNTLTISANTQVPFSNSNQHFQGTATLYKRDVSATKAYTISDMTDAYRPITGDARAVTKAKRGCMLLGTQQLMVQDEVTATNTGGVEVIWNYHTRATVTLETTKKAKLVQGGKNMWVQILSPSNAFFKTETCNPPPITGTVQPSNNSDVTNLTVRIPGKITNTIITVRLTPDTTNTKPAVQAMDTWVCGYPINPAAPGSLNIGAVTQTKVNLSWVNNANNEAGYIIERSVSNTTNFIKIDTVGVDATTYENTGLTAGTLYYYRILAYNTCGSSYSGTVSASTLSTKLPAIADAHVLQTSPTGNYGANTTFATNVGTASNSREGYIKFNLSGLTMPLSAIKLRLYGKIVGTTSSALGCNVYGVSNSTWTETGINWSNKPAPGSTSLFTKTVTNTTGAWYEWDITNYAKAEIAAGRTTLSLALKNTSASADYISWNSKENTTNQPELLWIENPATTLQNKAELQSLTWLATTEAAAVQASTLDDESIMVYPNPANTNVNLSFEAGRFTDIYVFDVYGNKIKQQKILPHDNQILMSVADLKPGLYLLKLSGNTFVSIKNLLID